MWPTSLSIFDFGVISRLADLHKIWKMFFPFKFLDLLPTKEYSSLLKKHSAISYRAYKHDILLFYFSKSSAENTKFPNLRKPFLGDNSLIKMRVNAPFCGQPVTIVLFKLFWLYNGVGLLKVKKNFTKWSSNSTPNFIFHKGSEKGAKWRFVHLSS